MPRGLMVSLFKLFGKLIYSLTYDLYIINSCMQPQLVRFQLGLTNAFGILFHAIYRIENIFQT